VSSVVFLRAVNVGGRKLSPREFVRELAEFDAVNVGMAGTFVIRGSAPEAALRRAIVRRLPFVTEVVIAPGAEVQRLVQGAPFDAVPAPKEAKPFLTVLTREPDRRPVLPLHAPQEAGWQLQVIDARGRYVLSLRRAEEPGAFYPNSIVERAFGVPGTTRGWATVLQVGQLLDGA
jgi:uncharacterized protein (DUF1697 family)